MDSPCKVLAVMLVMAIRGNAESNDGDDTAMVQSIASQVRGQNRHANCIWGDGTCVKDQCCPRVPESGGKTYPCPTNPAFDKCETQIPPDFSTGGSPPKFADSFAANLTRIQTFSYETAVFDETDYVECKETDAGNQHFRRELHNSSFGPATIITRCDKGEQYVSFASDGSCCISKDVSDVCAACPFPVSLYQEQGGDCDWVAAKKVNRSTEWAVPGPCKADDGNKWDVKVQYILDEAGIVPREYNRQWTSDGSGGEFSPSDTACDYAGGCIHGALCCLSKYAAGVGTCYALSSCDALNPRSTYEVQNFFGSYIAKTLPASLFEKPDGCDSQCSQGIKQITR